jgi:hypothetical protein
MAHVWSTAAWLLAGLGLVIAGLVLPLPPAMAMASWIRIVVGCVALVLGATQVEMMIGSLLQRSGRAGPQTGTDKKD